MKKYLALFVVCLVILGLIGCSQSQNSVTTTTTSSTTSTTILTGTGIINGKVYLDGQANHSNITVSVEGSSYSTTTASDGAFSLIGIPFGTYTITASSEHYISESVDNVSVIGGTGSFSIDLTLKKVKYLLRWGGEGSGDGYFYNYSYIAINSSGSSIYVLDTGNNRVQKFDSSGNFIAKWAGSVWGRGIAVDSAENVYVAATNCIQKYNSVGDFILQLGSFGSGDGQFKSPSGIAIDGSDNIYVADSGNSRIQKFDSSGNYVCKWGVAGSEECQFLSTLFVAVDNSSNVYVLDSGNSRVQKFDSLGNFITKWGSLGSGLGQFDNNVWGIAVDKARHVYVCENGNQRIQAFDSSGNYLFKWGDSGALDELTSYPKGIAIDISNNVYVSDTKTYGILKFKVAE